jgi:hypothetical protein
MEDFKADLSFVHCGRVEGVFDKYFPSESPERKKWVVNLISRALEFAQEDQVGNRIGTDSSLFRDYIVHGDDFTGHTEVFASTFMGMVASSIAANADAVLSI